MDYQQLDTATRLNLVRARLRDVEQQHFNLELRVNTPDLTQPVNDQDQSNLTQLASSISRLREMESELVAARPAPETP